MSQSDGLPQSPPVQHFPATSAPLLAASYLLEGECKARNDRFMRCRAEHENPADCAELARDVLDCSSTLYDRRTEHRRGDGLLIGRQISQAGGQQVPGRL